MKFKIYSAASGWAAVWEETHTTTISKGLVSVRLGTQETIALDFNSGEFYLGVTIGTDSELSPRIQLGAVPYAVNSKKLDGKTVGTGANNILGLNSSGAIDIAGTIKTIGDLDAGTSTLDRLTVASGLTVSAGAVSLPALSIQSAALANDLITGAKIADGAVGVTDLADGAVTAAKTSIAAIGSDGRIPALTSTSLVSLDGSNLTGITASVGADSIDGTELADTITLDANLVVANSGSAYTITIGDNNGTVAVNSSDWDVSATGALTGISGITTDGAYTQSGTGANTFTGASTFSASGTALSVTNNAEIDGTLDVDGISDLGGDVTFSATTPTIAITNAETLTITDGTNTLASIIDSGTTGYISTGALVLGTSYEPDLQFTGTVVEIEVANTGTLTFRDSASNTLMTLADGGTTGNATITGTLAVTGASTLTGLLTFNGGATADSGVFTVADTSGNVHTSGTLDVDSTSNFDGDVTLTGVGTDLTVGGTLGVTGISTFTANLNANGGLDVDDSFVVADGGAVTVGSTLGVTGLTTLNGGVTADSGVFTVADTSGNVHTSGTLDVDSTSDLGGDITFSATTPNIAITNTESLTITDGTNTLFTLADAGTTGNATVSGILAVTGASTLTGLLTFNGGATADSGVFTVADTSGNVHTSGTLDVDSTSDLGGDITFSAATPNIAITNAESLTITDGTNTLFTLADGGTTGNLTVSGDLTVSGGDITGANSASIDIGEATSGAITFSAGGAGDFVFSTDSNTNLQVTAGSANGVHLVEISNLGQATTTDDTDGLEVDYAVTNANSGSALDVRLVYTGGATDGLSNANITIGDGAPTNAIGTDTYIGLDVATLTDPGATITSYGVLIGSGWDINLVFNDATSNIGIVDGGTFTFTDGTNTLLTLADGGTTGNLTVTGDVAVNGDDLTSDGNLTVNATGYTRIGGTGTPGAATADNDLYVQGALEVDGAATLDSTLDVASTGTFNSDVTFTLAGAESFNLTSAPTANAGIELNAFQLALTTPAHSSGTNSHYALDIDATIGNATAGTNEVRLINFGPVTGDAQVTLAGINFGALTATAASEVAIVVGTGWDTALQLQDSTDIRIGTGNDAQILHNGTNTVLTSVTGNLVIDNTNTTGITLFTLGTDTSATSFVVEGDGGTDHFTVRGDSAVLTGATFGVGTDLTVNSGARIGIGSTPEGFTALVDDSLFVEGLFEVDGAARFDGGVTVLGGSGASQDGGFNWYTEMDSTVDFANTTSGSCSQSGDITITGATLGDGMIVSQVASGALTANTFLTGHVTALNTVRIQFCNLSGGDVNPGSENYRIRFIR